MAVVLTTAARLQTTPVLIFQGSSLKGLFIRGRGVRIDSVWKERTKNCMGRRRRE
jgi:hypothetical protein